MCLMCAKHKGLAKYWYLNEENYRQEVLRDPSKFEFVRDLMAHFEHHITRVITGELGEEARRALILDHHGQVVPYEDAIRIMEIVEKQGGLTVANPCVCRKVYGAKYDSVCIGWGLPVEMAVESGFHQDLPLEIMETFKIPFTVEDAKEFFKEVEEERSLVHTIWTFGDPYIGAICNCEPPYCAAFRARTYLGLQEMLLKAEYVARVDPDKCDGCGKCVLKCSFGAIGTRSFTGRASINPTMCFGCGVCRIACENKAISLIERAKVPIARDMG